MRIVGAEHGIAKVQLGEPTSNGYVLLAAEVERRLPLLPRSARKRSLLAQIKHLAHELTRSAQVLEATVFDALIFAPGQGKTLLRKAVADGALTPARFDVVILVRTATPSAAGELLEDPRYVALKDVLSGTANRTYEVAADNVRRIDEVAHQRGVFLFNYFFAQDASQLVPVWEYTAGWFMAKTHLRDSTVLRPLAGQPTQYGIINHASWPNLRRFLPHLIFRRTFKTYVLANFEANGIAAQPIIYRLA
jgi:hypothetical protein